MAPRLRPYPWDALDRLSRASVEAERRARKIVAPAVDLARLATTATRLLGAPVELQLREVCVTASLPEASGVRVALASPELELVVELEDALAARIVGRVVEREVRFVDPSRRVEPEVVGAASAFLVALLRRSGEGAPWRLAHGPRTTPLAEAHALAIVGDEVFSVVVWAPIAGRVPPEPTFDVAALVALGDLPISLPLVAAGSRARTSDLDDLVVGAAWAPGKSWTARVENGAWTGGGTLVAPTSERGIGVALRAGAGGRADVVVTPGSAVLPWDRDAMDEKTGAMQEGAEALAEAEVVVRVEVGTVTLPAHAWAKLAPGDVVATGVRIGEPVVLRSGGVAFARGELCDLEGELAVRILERGGSR